MRKQAVSSSCPRFVARLAVMCVFGPWGAASLFAEDAVVVTEIDVPPAANEAIIADDVDSSIAEADEVVIDLVDFEPAALEPAIDWTPAADVPIVNVPIVSDPVIVSSDDLGCCDVSCDEPSRETAECDETPCDDCEVPIFQFGDWLGYHPVQSSHTWVAGGDLGITSLESFPTLEFGDDAAIVFGTGFHFLSGPTGAADLPPRLFDFQMAFQTRTDLTSATTLDLKLGVGAFSDFEASARKGIRFPGHAVSHTQWSDDFATVFGVDVLDRDDISLLPVGGVIWKPTDDLVFDLVFPRPQIRLRTSETGTMYIGGELGGGTWAVERDNRARDNATYRDLRITWGLAGIDDESEDLFEIGWAFDRHLEYRSGRGDVALDGAFLIRWQTRY